MGRDRRLPGHPLPHRRRRAASATCSPSARATSPASSPPCAKTPTPTGSVCADRPDGRRPRDDPQHARVTFRIRIGPRTGRLRLQRRRPSQPDGTPLSAQAQPHQPLHVRISRLPLRESDARPFRGVHGSSNANGAGARGHTSELCAEQRAMQRAFDHFESWKCWAAASTSVTARRLHVRLGGQRPHVRHPRRKGRHGLRRSLHDHQQTLRRASARTLHADQPRGGPRHRRSAPVQTLLPPRRHPAQIHGHTPAPRRNRLQRVVDRGLRRRRTVPRLVPDTLLQPQPHAHGRIRRPHGGDAPPAAVRKPAGPHDLYLRRGDGSRIPPPGLAAS